MGSPLVAVWVQGILLNLTGTISSNLGSNLVKVGHAKKALGAGAVPWFAIGWLLFVAGALINFISFGLAAQSLLSALGSVQFVSNVFFAYILHGDPVTPGTVRSTLLIVIGIVIIFTTTRPPAYEAVSVEELAMLYGRPPYIVYITCTVVLVVALQIIYRKLCRCREGDGTHRQNFMVMVCYAMVSAIVGSQAVVLAKTMAVAMRIRPFQFHPLMFILTPVGICVACFWVHRLNCALRRFPAIIIIPALQISWITSCVVSGGILFDEFSSFNTTNAIGFSFGFILIACGIVSFPTNQSQAPVKSEPSQSLSESLPVKQQTQV
ncbi:Magnesium transporter [Plasmodiophora brassicae]|nr:hypothetical protein PBRA_004758 [Plasmodiophora brassicae]